MSILTFTRNLDPESVGATRRDHGRRLAAAGTAGGEAAQLRILRALQSASWRGVASAAREGAPAMPLQGTTIHDTRPLESPKFTTVRH